MSTVVNADPWIPAILAEPTIGGRYSNLALLSNGTGGFTSYVFEAHDTVAQRKVVLKFLRPDLHMNSGEAVDYFVREGEICGRLQGHPNIVKLVDKPGLHPIEFRLQNGSPLRFDLRYLALERATTDFDSYLFARRRRSPSVWGRLRLLRGVVKGVSRLHALGYCHRDLKPDNIFIFPGGDARLGDLGLCRLVGDPLKLQLYYDQPIGHKLYSPPESFCGAGNVQELGLRADWFSVGAILFEAMAGVRLYAAIGMKTPLDVVLFFTKHGPLDRFEKSVSDLAGAYPVPSLFDFCPSELLEVSSERTIQRIDALVRALCHFDHRRRLCDGSRALQLLDVAIAETKINDARRERSRIRRLRALPNPVEKS